MDYFGYHNADVAGRNAGAGIYSSARWSSERRDESPPAQEALGTRYQLRFIRSRLGNPYDLASLAGVIDEVEVGLLGVSIDTPRYVCPATRKRARE